VPRKLSLIAWECWASLPSRFCSLLAWQTTEVHVEIFEEIQITVLI